MGTEVPKDFTEFWSAYPRKVARFAAEKAYTAARKKATADEILNGLLRYKMLLPQEIRFVPHASSWLNAGRWLDEWPPPPAASLALDWREECQELHGGACVKRYDHEMRKTHGPLPCQVKRT